MNFIRLKSFKLKLTKTFSRLKAKTLEQDNSVQNN